MPDPGTSDVQDFKKKLKEFHEQFSDCFHLTAFYMDITGTHTYNTVGNLFLTGNTDRPTPLERNWKQPGADKRAGTEYGCQPDES